MHLPLSSDDSPKNNFAAGTLLRRRTAALRRRFRGLLFHRRAHQNYDIFCHMHTLLSGNFAGSEA
jgi:hypothetical protein